MPEHRHLSLHLFRLKPLQHWSVPRKGVFFVFAKAGAGEYHGDSSSVQPLGGGDVLVVQCGGRGKVHAGPPAGLVFYAFSLCIEHLFPAFAPKEIALVQPLLDGLRNARLHPAATSAAIGWHHLIREIPPGSDLEHRTQLLRVAGSILAEEFNRLRLPLAGNGRGDARINHLFEQLSANQILTLSVAEMAARFGCSERQLNRLFNEHFGLSVGMLRMEMRLLKAVPLLRNPNLKIVQVARQCGFNHLGLFHACFKRRFGLSPGQWRRNLTREEEPVRAVAGGRPSCRLREFGLCPLDEHLRQAPAVKQLCSSPALLPMRTVAVMRDPDQAEAPV